MTEIKEKYEMCEQVSMNARYLEETMLTPEDVFKLDDYEKEEAIRRCKQIIELLNT